MEYNIAIFAFEMVRDKFFYSAWLGDKIDFTKDKTGYWYENWDVIKAGGKFSALYEDLQRQIFFRWHAHALILWSIVVDVWWGFYVCWYIWASSEWNALANWENNFHWISFVCGCLCCLIKVAYLLMLFIEDIQADCVKFLGCCGWCKAFWCCQICTNANPLNWPTPPLPKEEAPAKKTDNNA